jgi:hypothetical protein
MASTLAKNLSKKTLKSFRRGRTINGKLQADIRTMEDYKPWIYAAEEGLYNISLRNDSRLCILANSVAYSIEDAIQINCSAEVICIKLAGWNVTWKTPPKLAKMAYDWDAHGLKHKPFRVRLGRPSLCREQNRPKRSGIKLKRTGKYVGESQKRKNNKRTSRRWHGLKLPLTATEAKQLTKSEATKNQPIN